GKPFMEALIDLQHNIPQSMVKNFEQLRKRLKNGEVITNVEIDTHNIHGEKVTYSYSAKGIRGSSGKIIGNVIIIRDFTNQKAMEMQIKDYSKNLENLVVERTKKLSESEAKYRAITDHANDAILVIKDMKIIFANQKVDMLGYTVDEFLKLDITNLLTPESLQLALEMQRRRLAGEDITTTYVVNMMHYDGHVVPVEINITIIQYEGERAILIVGRDITERQQAELKLKASEEKYSNVVEQAIDAICIVQDGILKFANKRCSDFTGYSVDQLTGMEYTQVIAPSSMKAALERIEKRRAGENLSSVFELDIIVKGGTSIPFELNSGTIEYEGKPATMIFLRDISERRKIEEALQQVHQEKISLVEETTEAIISVGRDARIEMANPAAEIIFGRSRHTLHNTLISSILSSSIIDTFIQNGNLKTNFTSGKIRDFEADAIQPDGTKIPVMFNAAIRKDNADNIIGLVMAISDMREQKKMQKKLLNLAHHSGMSEIATGVLHNVNNVLSSINISTELMKESIQKSEFTGLEKAITMMKDNIHNLSDFLTHDTKGKFLPLYFEKAISVITKERQKNLERINKLLEYIEQVKGLIFMQQSYALRGGLEEKIDLSEILDDAVNMHSNAFDRYNINITRNYHNVPYITIDRQKLIQVLLNIVKNARESLMSVEDNEELTLELGIDMCENDNGKEIVISIHDNGIGIPEENIDRIFEYGFTTKQYGSGFGLHASALSIMEMGGKISVLSDGVGKGAQFVVRLPIDC
ncbi:MAG: PAS domain S-box protein, partial [Thermodesulfobacteriota bacterium]|nr:PAS domain S-box protein [Thermodesulfobacteriota bacterium]